LVSPRTAKEYALATNGANAAEMPESLDMAGGKLSARDALAALDSGLYIGNLWYLNFSDRPACRMTGMTRFASFWVEDGKIVAREWMDYATVRVPELQEAQIDIAQKQGRSISFAEEEAATRGGVNRSLQRPRVFYRREADPDPIVVAKP